MKVRAFFSLLLALLLPTCALAQLDLTPYAVDGYPGQAIAFDAAALPGQPDSIIQDRGIAAGIRNQDGGPAVLLLYDLQGQLISQSELPFSRATLVSLQDDTDTLLITLLAPDTARTQWAVMRLSRNGQQLQQLFAEDVSASFPYTFAYSDGQGGAYLTAQEDGMDASPYTSILLAHVSAQGEINLTRTLRAKNRIVLIQSALSHPDDGTVTLYGSAVAASRGAYEAFALTLNPQGEMVSLDVRDFSARKDYGFYYAISPSGEVSVYSGALQDRPAVLVPFGDLPRLSDAGFSLE